MQYISGIRQFELERTNSNSVLTFLYLTENKLVKDVKFQTN